MQHVSASICTFKWRRVRRGVPYVFSSTWLGMYEGKVCRTMCTVWWLWVFFYVQTFQTLFFCQLSLWKLCSLWCTRPQMWKTSSDLLPVKRLCMIWNGKYNHEDLLWLRTFKTFSKRMEKSKSMWNSLRISILNGEKKNIFVAKNNKSNKHYIILICL